jgi:NADH:ubiquinone oxidoreductase subunit F (NADH-binding)/NADH:ubiquinone oxidoreductase subunit E
MPKTKTKNPLTFKPIDPEIAQLVARIGGNPESILEIYQALQAQHGYLTIESISNVARQLNIPAERAYGVATFYSMLALKQREEHSIRVCDGVACWLRGSQNIHSAISDTYPDWTVERTSCLGLCDRSPAALADDQQCGPIDLDQVRTIRSGWRGAPIDYSVPRAGEVRVMLANAGQIDPDSIDSALEQGAYRALDRALHQTAASIIDEIETAGLQGRGGAGFPVGRKWRFVAQAAGTTKYIVCNADESEPLIFKDRVLIDTNPHQLLEGMALAGYAVGASEAFIYIRGEYVTQAGRLERAIQQAEEKNWLGEKIRGTDFSFKVHVHRGAGAYICGEETALLESLEGKRGEPRIRPPFPATFGYHGLPTVVNNVETFSAVPSIILNGAPWYRSIKPQRMNPHGDAGSTACGTKIYMLLGQVNRPGLFEAPFGLTLRQIIDDFGGGMKNNSTFQFALTGGAAGTLVPESLLDVPIDYTSASKGVSLGAGAFLICDQSTSPVALLRELLHFFEVESCGKCTPCRDGTHEARVILDRMTTVGQVDNLPTDGQVTNLSYNRDRLNELAEVLQTASFCGLGQSVAIPMKSALKYFAEEFSGRSD